MKPFIFSSFILTVLSLAACSNPAKSDAPAASTGLIGAWQSLDDKNYVLKFSAETYREFYENEEMSRDQWQAVKSCDDPEAVAKTSEAAGGFLIWTQPTDDRICYVVSDWTAKAVSFTYAGTKASYTRLD